MNEILLQFENTWEQWGKPVVMLLPKRIWDKDLGEKQNAAAPFYVTGTVF